MDIRLYDAHLLLKSGPLGNKRRMFCYFGLPSSVVLIKTDIKTTVAPMEDTYPTTAELKLAATLDFIPASLRFLLQHLFVWKDTSRKVAGIGQAVVQAVHPRAVIAPLQLGVTVQMHHLYRSRFLIDSLSTMGFASSYPEVQRFEMNVACSLALDVLGSDIDILGQSLSFAGDNMDHNIITLDGKGTFHDRSHYTRDASQSLYTTTKNVEITKIDITDYRFSKHVNRCLEFLSVPYISDVCGRKVGIFSGNVFASTRVRPIGKALCTCWIRSVNIQENIQYNFSQW